MSLNLRRPDFYHTVLLIHIHLFCYTVSYCGILRWSELPHLLIHFISHTPTLTLSRSSSPSLCCISRDLHPPPHHPLISATGWRRISATSTSMCHNLYAVCGFMPVARETLWRFIAFRSTDSPAAPSSSKPGVLASRKSGALLQTDSIW